MAEESKVQLKSVTLKMSPELKSWIERHALVKKMTPAELIVLMLEGARARKP